MKAVRLPEYSLARAERDAIVLALVYSRGNKRGAARLLQIGKSTLYRKMSRYELHGMVFDK